MENNDFIDINSIIGNSNDSSKENVDNVIQALNDVLQAKRTIVKRKTPFVTVYSKALRKCYSDFFFLATDDGSY